jgi:BMFP domain-containing protein YqiC
MLGEKVLEELSAAANSVLPQQFAEDVKHNMRAALQSALRRLDLVTREELEVQEAVLARTRQKLQALEEQIAALEQRLQEPK